MNLVQVEPGRAQVIPFPSPQAGFVRGRVQTSAPANVYVLDAAGRARYAAGTVGAGLQPLWQSRGNQLHEVNVSLPPMPWYLVIENPGSVAISGAYMMATLFPSGAQGPTGPAATGGGWGTGGWGTGGGIF